VPALQVECLVSQSLLQEHDYSNTGGKGMLEGAEELGYGTYPAQHRIVH